MRVTAGEVIDVCVDLRRSSPTFGQSVSVILSAENHRQFWVPPGFAGLDYSAALELSCIAPKAITSTSHIITLPAARRVLEREGVRARRAGDPGQRADTKCDLGQANAHRSPAKQSGHYGPPGPPVNRLAPLRC